MAPPRSLLVERFKRLPRRSNDIWQGGVVRARSWIDDADGGVRRPWAAVWVSLATGMMNVQLAETNDASDDLALAVLIDLGLKFVQCRPAGLEVVDEALGASLAEALADPELTVRVGENLPDVDRMMREMERGMHGDRPAVPDALDAPGVTVERMRAFADAARDLYQAAPWQHLTDEDLIHVEMPAVASGLRYFTVLGAAAETFGLGFFGSPKEFDLVHEAVEPAARLGHRGNWSMLYGPIDEMPFGDVDLWEDAGLAVAASAAYPVAMWYGPGGELRRPRAQELADLTAILLALARTTEAEIDRGRWSHEVPAHDGPRTVTLAIPELLAPIDATPPRRPGVDRGAMERLTAEIGRFMKDSQFESLEQVNAALRQRFSGPIDDVPSSATTPLEKAQELIYRAFEARGRRRIQLARKALELSPDCADAYVLLAEESRTPDAARALYAEGVAAGERALGPDVFAKEAGHHFWGIVETRPYMRARFGLAQTLAALGRRDEAIEHYRELIRLNPDDNQGVRDPLLGALLLAGRDDEALTLIEQFGDLASAVWHYGRTLAVFRREGDSRAARESLGAALRINRHVPRALTGEDDGPGSAPTSYAPGSREEAMICDIEIGEAWRATPEAIRWLRAQAPARRSGKRRRR